MLRKLVALGVLGGALVSIASGAAQAQGQFPDRPVTLVNPLPAGGGVDIAMRGLAKDPRHTGQRLVEAIRDLPKVCKHVHLPVQSGSSRVLRAMRRRHTREEYLELLHRIRESVPGVTLSTDVIVGFPGETSEDFEETLSLTRAARYHSMFSFKYSPRPNTLAEKRMADDVTADEKTARIVALQALQREIQTELHEGAVGSIADVLVDSVGRRQLHEVSGRTGGNTVVSFPVPTDTTGNTHDGAWIGRTVPVRITRAGPHSLWGEAVLA